MATMGSRIAGIQGRFEEFALLRTDQAFCLNCVEFFFERADVSHLVENDHVKQRSRSHRGKAAAIGVQRRIYFVQQTHESTRSDVTGLFRPLGFSA